MKTLWEAFGGRKQFNTYVALALVVGYALLSRPDFVLFAGAVGAILGVGNLAIAWEDRGRANSG